MLGGLGWRQSVNAYEYRPCRASVSSRSRRIRERGPRISLGAGRRRPSGTHRNAESSSSMQRGDYVLPAARRIDGAEVVRIPFFGSTRYPLAPSVIKFIRDADVVHVHAIDFFFDYLAWTKPLHRRKLVVSTHGGFFHTPYAARLKQLYFLRSPDFHWLGMTVSSPSASPIGSSSVRFASTASSALKTE